MCHSKMLKLPIALVFNRDDYYDEVMNRWKSYMRTAGWRITWKKIIAVIDATFAAAKRRPDKIQACTGFEPLTSAIPVQRSTNWAKKPTGSRLLNWFVLNAWKDDDEVMNNYMKIIYENCGVKNYIKEHRRSYRRKKKAWKTSGLYERITKSLTFFTIISAVVRHILIDLSTTGWTSSCTARSMAGRTNCFRWGCCWNSGICKEMETLLGTTFTTTANGLLSFAI